PDGVRRVPFLDLHRLPGDDPTRDTSLQPGELVTAVELADSPAAVNSTYRKVRDRATFAFALISVAAAVELGGPEVRDVRIAWGGVAHKPWRAHRAEAALRGRPLTDDGIRAAVEDELSAASTDEQTAYKLPMLTNVTIHALRGLGVSS